MNNSIIKDVIVRTSGELYLGVVGSVRSGKSTFIRKFMEHKVLPYVNDEKILNKVKDELPQSSTGNRIMTVEPKFIPSDQMTIFIEEELPLKVRLIDSVGYVIPNAVGYLNDDGSVRLVKTPWYQEEIPFDEAAKLGTKKVIDDHCHIGVILTSDGSFGDFSREDYEKAEVEIVNDLKSAEKPFIIILNTIHPKYDETIKLKSELEEKYQVSVFPLNVLEMNEDDINELLKEILDEFKVEELNIDYPKVFDILDEENVYRKKFDDLMDNVSSRLNKMKDVYKVKDELESSKMFSRISLERVDAGNGIIDIDTAIDDNFIKDLLSSLVDEDINSLEDLVNVLQKTKEYKKISSKLGENLDTYLEKESGFIVPDVKEMILNEPCLLKSGNKYGIKLSATAKVTHICTISVDSSFEPIIGEEMQAKMLLEHMLEDYKQDPELIWNSSFFGQKLSDLISNGVKVKIKEISPEVEGKYQDSLEKIVNKGKGGVISIIL